MYNRLAKLLGTVVWAWYASKLENNDSKRRLTPHLFMAICLVSIGVSNTVLGVTHSGVKLELVMVISGFAYGINDSACSLLTLWLWKGDARLQRTYVALINVFFTGGAFVTPILIAACLHFIGDVVWPAFDLLTIACIIGALVVTRLQSPMPSVEEVASAESVAGDIELTNANVGEESSLVTPERVRSESGEGHVGTRSKSKLSQGNDDVVITTVVVVGTGLIAFFANGCEHAAATWLTTYGIHKCSLNEETMALMTSNYWTTMSLGRLVWAACSAYVSSAWPVLFLNATFCLAAGVFFYSTNEGMVWTGAILLGAGVSSAFPALITLAPELNIDMTPKRMAILQFSASGGEMICPFLMGIIFQMRHYSWFGPFMLVAQTASVVALAMMYIVTSSRRNSASRTSGTETIPVH